MDIESYNVLLARQEDLKKTLEQISKKSFDLKIERAKVERKLEKIRTELGIINVTDHDITGQKYSILQSLRYGRYGNDGQFCFQFQYA